MDRTFRIRDFIRAYTESARKSGILPFNWGMYVIFLCGVVPLSLIVFHLFIINGIIPHDIFNTDISLMYATPNVASMFFSNYAHMTMDNGNHLLMNVINFEATVIMILIVCLISLPLMHYKTPAFRFTFDPEVFRRSIFLYFILVPFVVSGVSIVVGALRGAVGGRGFSGIVCAFEGYLVYLGIRIVLEQGWIKRDQVNIFNIKFETVAKVTAIILPCIFFATIIADSITLPTSNFVGHIAGFLSGLLIPFMLEKKRER
jgi:hypothetical protein